ncbi:Coenzyme F420 hydrogenase/dehydrogenase, beta subunit C-terminal domain [Pseudaminobacter sp. NGMCC 1.201702]|uniref:Coenzyme F420 hydrogenase/dehydrogenase, beta subunit C-terminal domain n=1 Tax=Pseudaminobacter sp. NGMCC 1.201702 TaxID=3391825 RepID=UPI0039F0F523
MACSTDVAARLPSGRRVSPRDIVRSGLCIGCGSCVAQADRPDVRMELDRYGQFKPHGPAEWMRERTPAFSRTCPFSPLSRNEYELAAGRFPAASHRDGLTGRFEAAYVGHAREQDFRASGSSGGMVSWVAAELLRTGLVDSIAHVVASAGSDPDRRFFRYQVSRSEEEVKRGAKSRYYPVELSGVIEAIRATPGRYAVVGIPCFIKALHLLRAEDAVLRERVIFTLGLFCGHMKSARMVESFAWQMGAGVDEVESVEYRLKDPARPANWYTAQLTLRGGAKKSKDWWHLVDGDWGAGFFQNSACDFCDDVVAETADISFGDAWVEPYSSDGRGTNVVIVRSPVLHMLVRAAIADRRLDLRPVDQEFVEATQAAGFRQRREGLAFRLSWPTLGLRPNKRVTPRWGGLSLRRRSIYWMRSRISIWSHRMFWLAKRMHRPGIYLFWARAALTVYHGLAYSRGRLGRFLDRIGSADGNV